MLNGDAQGEGGNSGRQSKKVHELTDQKILWNIESALSYYAREFCQFLRGAIDLKWTCGFRTGLT